MQNTDRRYAQFVTYLRSLPIKPYQVAHALHLMQNVNSDIAHDGYATPPHTINIAVNNICNLKCQYCDLHHCRAGEQVENARCDFGVIEPSKKHELPLAVCQRIIDEVAWFRPTIRVPWMEPLLYGDIFNLIAYAKGKGLDFSLLSNGLLLKKYAEKICRLQVDALRVSLDGPQKTHDALCGVKGAYALIVEGLKQVVRHKRAGICDMEIGCYFTLTDQNYAQLLPLCEDMERLGLIEDVSISFYMFNYISQRLVALHNREHAEISGVKIAETSAQYINISDIAIDAIMEQKEAIEKRYSKCRIYFRPYFSSKNLKHCLQDEDATLPESRCDVLNHTVYINPDGVVKAYPPCILPPVGNIYENSVMDIWNGEAMRKQRMLMQKRGLFYGCTRCWGAYYGLEDAQNTWK
ncbi:radical SAM protein [uncultured Desulfovibrio sp.]|uniref:radical SAM protein n=1 Tax=uncultured Desulfovibrio sp. TaxID=167968 RepID=UPI002629679D|nr:radical SAM protein [uncultured Desulfovibrio sp.]